MGNEQSGEIECVDVKESEQKLVTCPHCYDTTATYRGRMVLGGMEDLLKYPKSLTKYWDTKLRVEKGNYVLAFVGCDTCISPSSEGHFEHVENGWFDDLFIEDTYKPIKCVSISSSH